MRALLVAFLLLPASAFCEEVAISLGMSHEQTITATKKLRAVDITLDVSWKRPMPLKSSFWELHDYDVVVELVEQDGKLQRMSYWPKKDFTDKSRRAETEQSIRMLSVDTITRKVAIEKTK